MKKKKKMIEESNSKHHDIKRAINTYIKFLKKKKHIYDIVKW